MPNISESMKEQDINKNIATKHPEFGRNAHIDLVRSVAMFVVIFFHVSCPTTISLGQWYHNMFVTSFLLMFFVSSGYFIFPLKGSGKIFILRRLCQIFPGFIIAGVCYAWATVYIDGDDYFSFAHRVGYVLFSPKGFLWFVPALIGVYLAVPFVSPWLERASRRKVEVFLVLCLCAGCLPVLSAFTEIHFPWESAFGPFLNFVGIAVAGYWLRRWPYSEWSNRRRWMFWVLVVAVLVFSIRLMLPAYRYGYCDELSSQSSANNFVMAIGLFIMICHIPLPWAWLRRLCVSIGSATYGIYLSHIAVLVYLLPCIGLGDESSELLRASITFVISFAMTFVWQQVKKYTFRLIRK